MSAERLGMEGEGRKAGKGPAPKGWREPKRTTHIPSGQCLKSLPKVLSRAGPSVPSFPLNPPIILPSTSS